MAAQICSYCLGLSLILISFTAMSIFMVCIPDGLSLQWQSNLTLDQACALVCPSDGEQCAPNTCCGDKDKTDKAQTTGGNPAQANQNNSFNVSAAADVEVDTLGEIAAADGNPRLRPVNKNPPGVSGFTSIHSLDVKFSPDGDEVVLEMSDMGHADNSGHKRTK